MYGKPNSCLFLYFNVMHYPYSSTLLVSHAQQHTDVEQVLCQQKNTSIHQPDSPLQTDVHKDKPGAVGHSSLVDARCTRRLNDDA